MSLGETDEEAAPSANKWPPTGGGGGQGRPAKWDVGSTYHDEENLAALLIEHDSSTGQLQVDGTIGNDFVIKPLPRATLEALAASRAQAQLATPLGGAPNNGSSSPPVASLEAAAAHLHDDDPHDDDEMFLDEDEALELAHLQASVSMEPNHTSNAIAGGQPDASPQLPQPADQAASGQQRAPAKVARERKWRKYRKLMAQGGQVPKREGPEASPSPAATSGNSSSSSSSSSSRARRHQLAALQISHHIVYRQRPSSEASSAEHRHSFMLAPGQQAMEAMARRFGRRAGSGPEGRAKRSAAPGELEEEEAADVGPNVLGLAGDRPDLVEADFEADPMGGQFLLEPGLETDVARAGRPDWLLLGQRPPVVAVGGAAPPSRLPPPPPPAYAINSTWPTGNATLMASGRYKRHAPGPRGHQVRRKRQAPDTVWPEVLLVVDYDSFLLHGGDSRDVKRYFVSFWNGVDLRYKLLVQPHIRISLAGMIVAKDRDATPYLERNRLRAPNADAVDAAGALTDMGKYLYREDRLPTYDLAVVITKLDMCRRRYEGGRCNRGTAGFAYVGGACVVNKRLEKVNSVAIIEDSGGFSGIIVAAHEVGHL